jgi:hypothetical protein
LAWTTGDRERSVLTLISLKGTFAVTRLPPEDPIPGWATGASFTSITRTPDELSIVCPQDNVPSGVEFESQWCCLRGGGRLDFSLVGILAAVTTPLAAAGVPVFAISTYNTDYLLVKARDFEHAVEVLRAAGQEVDVDTDRDPSEGPDVGLADENDASGSSASA